MQFEKNLFFLRKRKNLSQEELAFAIGVTRQTIYTWEAGLNYPNIIMLKKLADVLSVSTDELLNGFEVNKLVKTFKDLSLTYIGKHNELIKYEELPNWFVRLKPGEEVCWALYDLNKHEFVRDYSYHVECMDYVKVHDLDGIEIEVKEYDSELNFKRLYNQYISVKDEGVAWIGEIENVNGKKTIKTYKDADFLKDWGIGGKFEYQTMKYSDASDYILDFCGKKQEVIKISYFDPDGRNDPNAAYFEVFLNKDLESLMWRRYTKTNLKEKKTGEVININNSTYDMDYYVITSRL